MFPVRCVLSRNGPSFLGEDVVSKTISRASEDVSDAVVEAVIKQAAFSLSVQIALSFIPVLGQALSGLMSVTQQITGQIYEAEIKSEIAKTMSDIKRRAEVTEKRVTDAALNVMSQEYPAARQLAMSQQPLDGIGNFFETIASKTTSSVKKVIKQVPKQAVEIFRDPAKQMKLLTTITPVGIARLGVKALTNTAVGVAKGIESTNIIKEGTLTKPLKAVRSTTDDVLYSAAKLTTPITAVQEATGLVAKGGSQAVAAVMQATGNEKGAREVLKTGRLVHDGAQEYMPILTPVATYNLFTGREGLVAAREACRNLKNKAYAEFDKLAQDSIAKVQSPEGRTQIRVATAKQLRQNPTFIAQMQQLQELAQQEQAQLQAQEQQITDQVGPPPASGGAGTVVGIAAAVAAAFTFTR